MSIEQCNAIKGVFVVIILLRHTSAPLSFSHDLDKLGLAFFEYMGQMIVLPFLFFSGYGIMYSIHNKGNEYIYSFFKRRIFKLLLHFDLAVIIYAAVSQLTGKTITFRRFLLSLIAWDNVGNSNWFIFIILILYIFTWLAFSKEKNYLLALSCVVVLSAMQVFLFYHRIKTNTWATCTLFYSFGMIVFEFREKINKVLKSDLFYQFAFLGYLEWF